jgi:hypothetical protein
MNYSDKAGRCSPPSAAWWIITSADQGILGGGRNPNKHHAIGEAPNCGAMEYTVADALLYAANCHCSNCRRKTGSAFSLSPQDRGQPEIERPVRPQSRRFQFWAAIASEIRSAVSFPPLKKVGLSVSL